jgi:hypothetical protein
MMTDKLNEKSYLQTPKEVRRDLDIKHGALTLRPPTFRPPTLRPPTLRPPTFRPPVHFFSVSAFLSTRRGPYRSEAPSMAQAAPGNYEPLIGGARWRSLGELRLGQSVMW